MYLFWIVGKLFSLVVGFDLFIFHSVRDANWTQIAGRSLSALAGMLTILVTYRVGSRCYGRPAGLGAAFLLAVTPLHVQSSHFCTVDALVTLWMVVAFLAFLEVIERGEIRDYTIAGGLVGLGCATKLHATQLFVPLVVAHLIRVGPETRRMAGEEQIRKKGNRKKQASVFWAYLSALFDRKLFIAFGASAVVFALLVPSAVLRFRDYFDPTDPMSATNAFMVNTGEITERGSLHFIGTPRYLYYITNLFPAGMGIPLEIAVFAGIAWAAYRRRREDLLLLSFVIFYFLTIGYFLVKPLRYFLLWLPFVVILSSSFLTELSRTSHKAMRVSGIVLASAVGLYTLTYAAAFVGIYRHPDTRVEAARWAAANIPKGSVVLLERGHNSLLELLSGKDYDLRMVDVDKLLARSMVIDKQLVGQLENPMKTTYYRSALYHLYLRHADYLVIADDRLAARHRLRFAMMYYDALMDGGFGYTLVKQFTVTPTFLGIPFDDSGANVTWRQFDHPRVFVFRRTDEARVFDPNYRSILPLDSPQEAYKVFTYAVQFHDTLVLQGCLPRDQREAVIPEALEAAVDKLHAQPDLLHQLSEPRFAVQEANGWGIKVPQWAWQRQVWASER